MGGQNIPANNEQNHENMGLMPVLPPGFRFFPSDEEIFRYYLVNKNDRPNPNLANRFDHNVIRELDVYGYSPSELSENPFFEYGFGAATRHWYFYTAARGPAERQSRMRAVNSGFWLMRGRGDHAVLGGGGEVLGTKSCFVFYMGNTVQNAARTDWTLHEFALPDHAEASSVNHHHGDSGGAGNFDADFAAPPATGAPWVDYIGLNDFFSPLGNTG
ncbi:protein FEZ-like [Syzygium oleosum]|uniref:protein FEZ-like n=1 Tax=Syzygium oleosum TaxID=219896 RepID=UPI0011D1AF8B|nr:protein FEZ-like [Syzygium oleosum]